MYADVPSYSVRAPGGARAGRPALPAGTGSQEDIGADGRDAGRGVGGRGDGDAGLLSNRVGGGGLAAQGRSDQGQDLRTIDVLLIQVDHLRPAAGGVADDQVDPLAADAALAVDRIGGELRAVADGDPIDAGRPSDVGNQSDRDARTSRPNGRGGANGQRKAQRRDGGNGETETTDSARPLHLCAHKSYTPSLFPTPTLLPGRVG